MSANAAAFPATDPRSSAWVSANAGAGKTHLLADRVTRLLLDGADPSRILCLTFTKAAAAEMSGRLFQRLGEWTLLRDGELRARLVDIGAGEVPAKSLRQARRLFAQALETPGGLKIQTIHAFCQHLLARFPVEAGIPARFNVLDERSAAELMRKARETVLERAMAGDPGLSAAVGILATRAADARFAEILDLAIAQAAKLRGVLAVHGGLEEFSAHLRATLAVAPDEDEASILAEFCTALGGERGLCERAVAWLLAGSVTDGERGEQLAGFVRSGYSAFAVERLGRLFMTSSGPRKAIATKGLAKAQPELNAFLEQWQQRYIAMDQRRRAALTVSLTEALMIVAMAVLDAYDASKRASAALDYDDLIGATVALLERENAAAWVLYKLDKGLDHIVVDEAQDTSPEQWRIVARLADEFFAGRGAREDGRTRTVFAVGDEKQSIFSFQGAAPEEFGRNLTLFRKRAENAQVPFVEFRPAVSRRSAKTVLHFVDEVFADPAARDGLTSSGGEILHEPHRSDIGRVEFWPAVKPPETGERDPWEKPVDAPSANSAHVLLAAKIAERIKRWCREGAAVPGTERAITPGNIMILVRRRNAFSEEMIRQLIERSIPVAGADRMVLMDQIAIMDLLALGRFTLLPEDDLNLAALLKSPMLELDEDELYALCQPRTGGVWQELQARKHECPSFTYAHGFLAEMLGRADYLPPFEFYAHVLAKGMRRRLVARLGAEAADAIDEFLALALAHESAHPPSLESFLDWFASGASEVKRDMEQGGGAVRVMTVHGAKGLEADIVIVPDTAQVPDHERRAGILCTDDCIFFGVPKALETEALTRAKAEARGREMREYRRLLYVALTRAREYLIVCGYETRNGVHAESWYPRLKAVAESIGIAENDEVMGPIFALGVERSLAATPAGLQASGAAAALPAFVSTAAPSVTSPRTLRPSEAADDVPVISPVSQGGTKRFARGLLVHALLAALPELPPDVQRERARAYLARNAVSGDDAEALIRETMAIIENPIFAPLFATGSRSEIGVTALLPELGEGTRIGGQIDRLAVTEHEVLIADFKTNRPPPQTVEQVPTLYRAQLALYREALRKIYPQKRVRCALVWTDGARLMEVPDALLDAEIRRITERQPAAHSL